MIYLKQVKDNLIQNITQKIQKGEEISPFLFLSDNLELLDSEVNTLATQLLKNHDIPVSHLFIMRDDGESLKIKDMKIFLEKSHRKASFAFQVFLIENISRMTIKSANASLKFLEEPGVWNLVFLTNNSEAGILDTILSRVQSVQMWNSHTSEFRDDYYSLISSYIERRDTKIISHFFSEKLEKSDCVDFLKTLIYYTKKNPGSLSNIMLSELEEDINLIQRNNLLPKYVIDKYLLRI